MGISDRIRASLARGLLAYPAALRSLAGRRQRSLLPAGHWGQAARDVEVWPENGVKNEATRNRTAGFSPCFHLLRKHFGVTLFLTHSQMGPEWLFRTIAVSPQWISWGTRKEFPP